MRRADLVGHLNTFLHRQLTAARVTDPSNASFMGLYSVLDQLAAGASELMASRRRDRAPAPAAHQRRRRRRAGHARGRAAIRPARTARRCSSGMIDAGGAMLLAGGAARGQLSTAPARPTSSPSAPTDAAPARAAAHPALGVGRKVAPGQHARRRRVDVRVGARAALRRPAPSRLRGAAAQARENADRIDGPLRALPRRRPHEHRAARRAFTGLTLATTREQMLSAVIESIAAASAARLELLARDRRAPSPQRRRHRRRDRRPRRRALSRLAGGSGQFRVEDEASLARLARDWSVERASHPPASRIVMLRDSAASACPGPDPSETSG